MTDAPPTAQRPYPPEVARVAGATFATATRTLTFNALVADAGEAVARFLYGMTGDRATAEDLAQETFLLAWTHIDELR